MSPSHETHSFAGSRRAMRAAGAGGVGVRVAPEIGVASRSSGGFPLPVVVGGRQAVPPSVPAIVRAGSLR